jgi:UDP-N-acetylmuramoyl-tripeptide--D-alanyl-D-alanine ligase
MQVSDILAVPDAVVVRAGPTHFSRATVDTRDIVGGEVFFAIPGPSRDGHDFVAAAIAAGAVGLVISRDLSELSDPAPASSADLAVDPADVTVIRVPDALAALQGAASAVRQRSSAAVIAVTGSAGKTTAKTLIAHVLAAKFEVLSNRASFNNHLGVPLTLTGIQPEHSHVVAEIGTNHRGEIAHLTGLVDPDVAVITNIGLAHLGNFVDQNELAQEKTDLLRRTRSGGLWILNGDDELLTTTAAALPGAAEARVVRVGFGPGNDLRAVDVEVDERGTRGTIEVDGEPIPFSLAAAGRHFAYAAMLAIAVGRAYGIEPTAAVEALRGVVPPSGRASLRRISDRLLVVDDSYNGSPDSMSTSLDLLGSLPGRFKVAVLGEMRELGSFSAEIHERIGRAVASNASHLITVGADTGPMRAGAAEAGLDRQRIWSAGSALEAYTLVDRLVAEAAGEDAVVLVKGSRFMHMERVYLGLAGRQVACPLSVCPLYIHCQDCPQLEVG